MSNDAALLLLFLALAYMLPTLIAIARMYSNTAQVFVVNLFLGWTFVGWVVALAMAVRRES